MVFKCPRCGHATDIKCNMIKHINRKKLCNPILSDKIPKKYQEKILKGEKEDKVICEFCNKTYSRKDSLERHLKKCSKKPDESMKKLVKELNEKLSNQDKQLDSLKELVKNSGNTTIYNTTNNTVNVILSYKDTDVSHLTDKNYYKALSRCIYAVPELISQTHFNENKPENHNIYLSNMRGKWVSVYNGKKWLVKDKAKAIDDLIHDNHYRLDDWYHEDGKKYPKVTKKFNLYQEKRDEDGVYEKMYQDIEEQLYNNRDIVEKTIKERRHIQKT